MLRLIRPDLLCGLGGFVLGAAALLVMHLPADTPQPPVPADRFAMVAATPALSPAPPAG